MSVKKKLGFAEAQAIMAKVGDGFHPPTLSAFMVVCHIENRVAKEAAVLVEKLKTGIAGAEDLIKRTKHTDNQDEENIRALIAKITDAREVRKNKNSATVKRGEASIAKNKDEIEAAKRVVELFRGL